MRSIITILIASISFSLPNQKALKNTPVKIKELPGQVVFNFYNWYLKKVYNKANDKLSNPNIIRTKDSIYQIDSEIQLKELKETGFFSDDFFKNQLSIYSRCDVQLRQVKPKDVDKCGCSPTEFVRNNDCAFLSYYTWIGGQGENINTVKIYKIKTIGNLSKVTVQLSDGQTLYSHAEVTLIRQNNTWKISKIDLRYYSEKQFQ